MDYRRQRLDVFQSDDRVAEYLVMRSQLALAAGITLSYLGQLRLGWHATRWTPTRSNNMWKAT